MQNILLVLDGGQPDINTTEFACFIANLTHSRLNTLFIRNIKGEPSPALKQLYALPYVETITTKDLPENDQVEEACVMHEKSLANACLNRGVNLNIHYFDKAKARDIIAESRFADLIILNPAISFDEKDTSTPTAFVEEILSGAECPVAIAPYRFDGIDELVFSYDGGRSAVYAIRQFAYLFPELTNRKLTVLQVDEKPGMPVRERKQIETLLQNHFSEIVYRQCTGNAADQLFEYLIGKENVFVIMGAYGKGVLANPFRHSRADLLVKTVNIPVFTAHH